MKPLVAIVEANAEPMPGMHLVYLHCPYLGDTARPGQFVMVQCASGYDPYLRQPLALHRLTDQGVALCFRSSSSALAWLAARRVGDAVDLLGPCGRGFTLSTSLSTVSLVARGMGIAPLLAILDRVAAAAQLITSVPTAANVYPRELLPHRVEYMPFVGQEQDEDLARAITEACRWGQRVYACGPLSFYASLRQALEKARLGLREGVAEVWIKGQMACGMGACRACLIETRHGFRRVCTDGPVFDLATLLV
jgi:dihydroorotate dehydrogenase electron transfer subunit